jgi:hypothetical protein
VFWGLVVVVPVVARSSLGPKVWPVFGILPELRANWLRLHDWVTGFAYKVHTLRVHLGFGFYVVFTVDPANVEYIMKTNFNNYPKVKPLPLQLN